MTKSIERIKIHFYQFDTNTQIIKYKQHMVSVSVEIQQLGDTYFRYEIRNYFLFHQSIVYFSFMFADFRLKTFLIFRFGSFNFYSNIIFEKTHKYKKP